MRFHFSTAFTVLLCVAVLLTVGGGVAEGGVMDELVIYPEYPAQIRRDAAYSVAVSQNGAPSKVIPVYNPIRPSMGTPGFGGTYIPGDDYRRFCEFGFSGGAVTVTITVNTYAVSSYKVMPTPFGIQSARDGKVLTLTLIEPTKLVVRLNDDDNTILSVFADEIETDAPKPGDPNVMYYGAGWHDVAPDPGDISEPYKHRLVVPADTTLYLAPGAVLNGRVSVGGNNVTIRGRGMIRDSYYQKTPYDMFLIYIGSKQNAVVRDIKLADTNSFNLVFNASASFCTVRNVRMLSNAVNSDGPSFWGPVNNISVTDCFIYTGDNVFVIGGGDNPCYNLTMERNIVGAWANPIFPQGRIGRNVKVSNLYLFRDDGGTLVGSSFSSGTAAFDDLAVENVYALDCLSSVRLFYGKAQGVDKKKITFKNVRVPAPSSQGIYIVDGTAGNYDLSFENVTYEAGTAKIYLTDAYTAWAVDNGSPRSAVTFQPVVGLTGVQDAGFEASASEPRVYEPELSVGNPVYTLKSGQILSGLQPSADITVSVALRMTVLGVKRATVMTALYNAAGQVQAAACDSGEFDIGGKTFVNDLKLPPGTTSDCYLRTFVWSELDLLNPYCDPLTFPQEALGEWKGVTGLTGAWSVDTAQRRGGERALKVVGAGSGKAVWQSVGVAPNTLYQLNFYAKGDAAFGFRVTDLNGKDLGQNRVFNESGNDWAHCSVLFYAEDNADVKICFTDDGATGVSYIDDVGLDDLAATSDNLLKNPGFEGGLRDWESYAAGKFTLQSVVVHSGMAAGRIYGRSQASNGVQRNISQILYDNGPGTYQVEAWVRTNSPAAVQVGLKQRVGGASSAVQTKSVSNAEWVRLSGQLNLGAWSGAPNAINAGIYIEQNGGAPFPDIYVDDLSLVKLD
ncbi:hypothetical protein FACS189492_1140 [Clostridia bacterium]|nr:hypothetical protein FACS189492_1140 [Clostridia bacterium]